MSECLIYQLKPGRTTVNIIQCDLLLFLTFTSKVGRMDSEKAVHIRLSGDNILEEHCYLENTDGKVTLHALPDAITVRLYRPFIPGPYVIVHSF
jgi:kinesin family member 1